MFNRRRLKRRALEIGFFLRLPGSHLLDRSRFPHLGCPTDTTGHNPPTVWRKDNKSPEDVLPFEGEQLLAAGGIPQPGASIGAAGENALAVRRKGHRPDRTTVPFEDEQLRAGGRVPYFGRPRKIAGQNPPAIRRKGHRLHVPWESEPFVAVGRLPHPGYSVISADNALAVRRKGHRRDHPVLSEGQQFFAGVGLPHLGRLIQKATQKIPSLCPLSVDNSLPLAASHTLSAGSRPPLVTMRWSSGEKATA